MIIKADKEIKERKYYKYQDAAWAQPTLTSNGVMGGDTMAVAINWAGFNYNYGTPYTIFSPNTGNAGFYCDEWKSSMYITAYYPQPLRATNIKFSIIGTGDEADGAAYNVHFYGGNFFNNRLEEIAYLGDTWGVDTALSSTSYYQYYTLYLENGGGAYEDKVTITGILISGVVQTVIEGTSEDYDFYKDIYNIKAPEYNNKYYAYKGS